MNQKLSDGSIEIVAKDSDDGRIALWHTAAVVLAAALHDLYPNVKFGEGGVTEHGFTSILIRKMVRSAKQILKN